MSESIKSMETHNRKRGIRNDDKRLNKTVRGYAVTVW